MGIFDALTTAVSGLQAQSFALQNISGNIANSQTIGYKETDTSFDALVSQAALGEQTSGGVFASSVATNGGAGHDPERTVATDMAINGDGYFVVAQPTANSDNQPQFSGVNDYTRARRFPDEQQRLYGQRRRLLSDGHSGRSGDRSPTCQLAPGFAIRQQFPPGAGDDEYQLSGKPAERAADGCAQSR